MDIEANTELTEIETTPSKEYKYTDAIMNGIYNVIRQNTKLEYSYDDLYMLKLLIYGIVWTQQAISQRHYYHAQITINSYLHGGFDLASFIKQYPDECPKEEFSFLKNEAQSKKDVKNPTIQIKPTSIYRVSKTIGEHISYFLDTIPDSFGVWNLEQRKYPKDQEHTQIKHYRIPSNNITNVLLYFQLYDGRDLSHYDSENCKLPRYKKYQGFSETTYIQMVNSIFDSISRTKPTFKDVYTILNANKIFHFLSLYLLNVYLDDFFSENWLDEICLRCKGSYEEIINLKDNIVAEITEPEKLSHLFSPYYMYFVDVLFQNIKLNIYAGNKLSQIVPQAVTDTYAAGYERNVFKPKDLRYITDIAELVSSEGTVETKNMPTLTDKLLKLYINNSYNKQFDIIKNFSTNNLFKYIPYDILIKYIEKTIKNDA